MKPMWMVRAAEGGIIAEDFKEKNVVAIGWAKLGDLTAINDRDKIIDMVQQKWPEMNKRQAIASGSQVYKFRNAIKTEDRVITYDPSRRIYLVGTIMDGYDYDTGLIDGYPHYRKVKWDGEVSRDIISVSTKNTLGAISTLFLLSDDAANEMERLLKGKPEKKPTEQAEESDVTDLLKDTQSRSNEFIKDQLNKLDWDKMQELVAGLLRAMGYKTRISPSGPDRGKDIIASPDGLGFENPRIAVEVKHRSGTIGAPEIRSFLGGRHKDDKGLYVSTGGFTKEARYEADRAAIPLTLMDLDDLVSVIVEHYEDMDMDARVLIPLTKLYWPA